MIEVPGQPRGDLLAVDYHDVALTWRLSDFDDARVQGSTRPRHGGNRMVLQRAENLADLHLQPAVGFDILEENHAALVEDSAEPVANLLVFQHCERDARDPCAEREVVTQRSDVD